MRKCSFTQLFQLTILSGWALVSFGSFLKEGCLSHSRIAKEDDRVLNLELREGTDCFPYLACTVVSDKQPAWQCSDQLTCGSLLRFDALKLRLWKWAAKILSHSQPPSWPKECLLLIMIGSPTPAFETDSNDCSWPIAVFTVESKMCNYLISMLYHKLYISSISDLRFLW